MPNIRGIDDIEADREEADREEMKAKLTTDIKDIVNRLKPQKPKKKRSLFKWLLILLVLLGLLLLVINFVLVNIWFLKFFIKSLFGV